MFFSSGLKHFSESYNTKEHANYLFISYSDKRPPQKSPVTPAENPIKHNVPNGEFGREREKNCWKEKQLSC